MKLGFNVGNLYCPAKPADVNQVSYHQGLFSDKGQR